MRSLDAYEDGFPHGTVAGGHRGSRTGARPALNATIRIHPASAA
jgi:hypothetical protein